MTLNTPITVQGFTLNSPDASLAVNGGGTLQTSANSFVTAGTLFVSGGTVRGGNITLNGGTFSFAANGNNILDAVTVNGTLTFPGGGFARLTNGTSFTQADLSGNNTTLIVEGTAATPASTLSGSLINLDSGAGSSSFGLSGNMTLTLASNTTVRGQGTIGSDLQFSGLGTLINQGLISADVATRNLTINPDVFTNEGTVRAINGATLSINSSSWSNPTGTLSVNASTLNLGGTFTSPGAISRIGGTVNITGLWNNTGNTYTLDASTGNFQLNAGTIRGGTINQSGGALTFAGNGANILDAVALNGTMQLLSGGFARLQNGTSFTQADLSGNNTFLIVEGTAATPASTLSGSLINLDSGAGSSAFGLSGNITLTLAPSTMVRGQGTIGSDLQFSGLGTLINQGVISADVSTRLLTINPDVFTNQGTAQAVNGATLTIAAANWNNNTGTLGVNASTLNLGGTFTNPGAISRTGGTINVTGLWDNTGLAYTLNASTGDFVMNGGVIRGGTLNQNGGSLRPNANGNNILDGVVTTGTLLLSNASSFLRLQNATSFAQVDLTGTNSTLTVEGTAATPSSTLSGATVNLDAAGVRFGASGNITLTLASTTIVRGMGSIGSDLQFSGLGHDHQSRSDLRRPRWPDAHDQSRRFHQPGDSAGDQRRHAYDRGDELEQQHGDARGQRLDLEPGRHLHQSRRNQPDRRDDQRYWVVG